MFGAIVRTAVGVFLNAILQVKTRAYGLRVEETIVIYPLSAMVRPRLSTQGNDYSAAVSTGEGCLHSTVSPFDNQHIVAFASEFAQDK